MPSSKPKKGKLSPSEPQPDFEWVLDSLQVCLSAPDENQGCADPSSKPGRIFGGPGLRM